MADFDGNKSQDAIPIVVSQPQYNKNFCKYCGKELQLDAAFCSSCGRPQGNAPAQQPTVHIMQQPVEQPYAANPQSAVTPNVVTNTTTFVVEKSGSNSMGTAGFIIALLGFIFCWMPIVDIILWFLGLVFSIIGIFKAPRGMAIAGLILSLVIIIVIIIIWGTIMELLDTIVK